MDVWDAPYVPHRYPRVTDLRADPFEHAMTRNASWQWQEWSFRKGYLMVPAQVFVGDFLASFKEVPPRGKPASFSVGDALSKLQTAPHGKQGFVVAYVKKCWVMQGFLKVKYLGSEQKPRHRRSS